MDRTLARLTFAGLLAAVTGLASAAAAQDVPIPPKAPAPPSEEGAPTVTIRSSENGDRVEEYREAGKVYMVRITPAHGKPYYLYDDDRNGRLDRSDADRHTIAPVYWTIYEWD
jgi:hypothetical protein